MLSASRFLHWLKIQLSAESANYEARTLQPFAVSGVRHASVSVSDTDTTPVLRFIFWTLQVSTCPYPCRVRCPCRCWCFIGWSKLADVVMCVHIYFSLIDKRAFCIQKTLFLSFIFYFLCSESWMSFTSLIKEYFVFMLWCMTVFYFLFSLLWCMTVLYFCDV